MAIWEVTAMSVLQVRSRSNVSFASDASPTAATVRSTRRCTRPPSPTTARPWAAPSPTPTPAPCASTWRFTSSHHLPLNPRMHTTPSHINSNNLIRLSSSPSTLRLTASLHHSPTKTLIYLSCPITSWISAQPAKWATSCCCGARPRWRCLWISLCQAWGVSWLRSSRVAGPARGGASAQSTQPYLSCLTLKSGMSVPGLQRHTSLCFTPTTSNQNLVMMRSMSRRMGGPVNLDMKTRRPIFSDPHQARGCSVEPQLLSFSRTSTCMVQRPFWEADGCDQTAAFTHVRGVERSLDITLCGPKVWFDKFPEGTGGIPSFNG